MSARRYYNGNESHSFNLGVTVAGMAVAHSEASPALPAKEQVAYESYVDFSRKIGAPVLSFEDWYLKDSGIGTTYDGFLRFHGYELASVGRGSDVFAGRYEPPRREWNGSWDNSVRNFEESRV